MVFKRENITASEDQPVTPSTELENHPDKKTILLVDDDISLTFVAQHALEKRGFLVVVASNGEEALSSYCRHMPSAILLDLVMPEVNGFEI